MEKIESIAMVSLLPLVRKHCWPNSILMIQAYLYREIEKAIVRFQICFNVKNRVVDGKV